MYSIISGSTVLSYFSPSMVQRAGDMDWYVGSQHVQKVVRYLYYIGGYVIIYNHTRDESRYKPQAGMTGVVTMCNGSCTVDVIVSGTNHSITPIFHFHLTAIMNFILGDGFFSAYPNLVRTISLFSYLRYVLVLERFSHYASGSRARDQRLGITPSQPAHWVGTGSRNLANQLQAPVKPGNTNNALFRIVPHYEDTVPEHT
ncbi:hypothetical protein SERLA73DRAFT_149019 [Serpula lacrymans var. lacrymans S7.3]|uniref:Uncharacterized protein n=1 Tax=Serpula lacrymans var. lacrymans (strain S7.3) TaxID=936435 RepID=F8PHS7_SERL3|nr:hypothetical protein SERLA73DRAFT_149019 [Serpula lacrymans var. lacrymans S7.3]